MFESCAVPLSCHFWTISLRVHIWKKDGKKLVRAGVCVETLHITHSAEKAEGQHQAHSPAAWASRLACALTLMPNLRAITLANQVAEIVACSPEFTKMLISRPHLRSLNLFHLDIQATELLSETTAWNHTYCRQGRSKYSVLQPGICSESMLVWLGLRQLPPREKPRT